jgi:hypothetical protein
MLLLGHVGEVKGERERPRGGRQPERAGRGRREKNRVSERA